jgi:hypothetical protein
MDNRKYTFFWKDASPFSQWHKAGFTIDGVHYKTAEHWMMWKKAMLFGDAIKAEEVLQTKHPKDAKQKGREVAGFKHQEWEQNCQRFVYEGNHAKFTQNKALLQVLLGTGDTLLVEASPYDKIWGIGLDEEQAKKMSEEQWPGTNYLGKVLTQLRDDLKQQSKNK